MGITGYERKFYADIESLRESGSRTADALEAINNVVDHQRDCIERIAIALEAALGAAMRPKETDAGDGLVRCQPAHADEDGYCVFDRCINRGHVVERSAPAEYKMVGISYCTVHQGSGDSDDLECDYYREDEGGCNWVPCYVAAPIEPLLGYEWEGDYYCRPCGDGRGLGYRAKLVDESVFSIESADQLPEDEDCIECVLCGVDLRTGEEAGPSECPACGISDFRIDAFGVAKCVCGTLFDPATGARR